MQKVLYLLTLLLITVYTYADVSPVVINRLTNNEGLSNSSVNVIYQDSNNLMWFGTWDGLNLYNSREFKTFKPNPNVPGNITNNIIRDIIETTKVDYGSLQITGSIYTLRKLCGFNLSSMITKKIPSLKNALF